jgi:hypothetical protein
MNLRCGFFRIWILFSALWLAAWVFYVWDSRLIATEDQTGRQFVAYHTDFGGGWKELSEFSAFDYVSLAGIGLGLPVIVLLAGAWIAWALAGFRSN